MRDTLRVHIRKLGEPKNPPTMKHFRNFLVVVLLVSFISACGDDDPVIPPEEQVEEPKKEEPKVEEPTSEEPGAEEPVMEEPSAASNIISDNLRILGATKIEGMPPSPNEGINMIINNPSTTAFKNEGVDIPLFSETDFVGAYIQVKAKDNNMADSYYDVNIEAHEIGDTSGKRSNRAKKFGKAAKVNSIDLDIDLAPALTTGEFCYTICIYDSAGNISAPQEVCVTIASFGGNEALVGEWSLTRESREESGVIEVVNNVGEEDCDNVINYCDLTEYFYLTFNADGTFEYVIRDNEREIDGAYDDTTWGIETVNGNWSYTTGKLYLLEYDYSYATANGVEDMETYALGDADVYDIGRVVVDQTSLVLIEVDVNRDGSDIGSYSSFFEKRE